ncbi:hypothetical protein AAH978_05835 [Streptomyces sp. ZYX-F-203]
MFFGKGRAISWASKKVEGLEGITDTFGSKLSSVLEDGAMSVIGWLG